MAAAATIESWDDDADFAGDFHAGAAHSIGTAQGSLSSRVSVRSESVAAEDDWNLVLPPADGPASAQAIQSAKQAGIPLPDNIPTSALLGGTIKRLGKKKMKQKLDDWDHDLEMTDEPLVLKPRPADTSSPSIGEMDDFEDLEGSLGIRFGGTARDNRARSSSISVLSPSLGSVTAESEIEDLGGLELPEGPMDFDAMLKKRRATEAELSDMSQPSPVPEQTATANAHKKSRLHWDDSEDFMNDLELGPAVSLDVRKRTANQNIKVRTSKPTTLTSRGTTTVNFHDKPTERPVFNRSHIPRPISGVKQTSRLEPVFETGAPPAVRERRQPTTTHAQLLKSKRSAPALRNQSSTGSLYSKPSLPFLPAGASNFQSPHASAQRNAAYHLRRESDPSRHGAHSPPLRPTSRLAQQVLPDTPSRVSRQRPDVAPASLAREATSKRTLTRPTRQRNFGDGSELEIFDDLPTSTVKESRYMKQPVARGPPRPGLRQTQSRSDIRDPVTKNFTVPDRMMTPAPRAPLSPTRGMFDGQSATPSYLRDTAASRIARETRLANNPRPRSEGPLQPMSTNWKAQVAARSPYTSPNASRPKLRRKPQLITNVGVHVAKNEKGMVYNPHTLRWEGNENMLANFDEPPTVTTPTPSSHRPQSSYMDHHGPSTSPSRPGLIAHIPTGSGHNVQVQNGMVYDPQQMKWLRVKGGRHVSGQLSPSVTDGGDNHDEEDAFAGIEDLKEDRIPVLGGGGGGGVGGVGGLAAAAGSGSVAGLASPISLAATGVGEVHEEFDLGPRFIQLQRDEEVAWRKRCETWFVDARFPRPDDGAWRHALRALVPHEGLEGIALSG